MAKKKAKKRSARSTSFRLTRASAARKSSKKRAARKTRTPVKKRATRARSRRSKAKKSRGFSFGRFFIKLFAIGILFAALIFGGWIWTLDRRVQARFNEPFKSIPAHLYARPYTLRPGDAREVEDIRDELLKQGYRQVKAISKPGDFATSGQAIDIFRPVSEEYSVPRAIRVILREGHVQQLVDHSSARPLEKLQLSSELIGNLVTGPLQDRILLRLHDVPELLLDGLITMEDRRFASHHGVDPLGILRAMVQNIRLGRVSQGGSTLTQQLVKNLYLDDSRTYRRKINEAMMALIIEARYSKAEILERYVNTIFLGQSGNRAIHGFGLAAEFYFEKKLQDLNPAQLSLLVGMIPAPSAYNPFRNIERATVRRNLVLRTLHENGYISAGEVELYRQTDLGVVRSKNTGASRYPEFTELLNRQLGESYNRSYLEEGGLKVYSTLDERVQAIAQQRFGAALTNLEKEHGIEAGTLQGAMIIVEPHSGEIVSLIGGRDSKAGDFNRALDARRPIGSLVKPAVYLTALLNPSLYSTMTPVVDAPYNIELQDGQIWQPGNYDSSYHGEVSIYDALIHSYNIPAVKVGMDIGLDSVATTLQRLGVNEEFPRYPAMLLGAASVSPLEITQMYQTLANGGRLQPLTTLRTVTNINDHVITSYQSDGEQMVNAKADFLVMDMMRGVAESGTARALTYLLPDVALAGKTGTTNEYRDSWFAGFGGNYLAVVWVGKDDNTPTGLTGSSGALRVWARVMSALDLHGLKLVPPEGVVELEVDVDGGGLAVADCTQESARRYFIAGYEPLSNQRCQPLDDKLGAWLQKWFGNTSDRSLQPQKAPPSQREEKHENR